MPPCAMRNGANCTRVSTPSGNFAASPFVRLESGMPQIGQSPGSARTIHGCIGQKYSTSARPAGPAAAVGRVQRSTCALTSSQYAARSITTIKSPMNRSRTRTMSSA